MDIYDISMGNPSFQSSPMPFRSPTKPVHFTKEIENVRGENGMPRFFSSIFVHENDFLNYFKARGSIAEVLTFLKTPIYIPNIQGVSQNSFHFVFRNFSAS